ncbi:MAG: tRNA (adenine(22)-N(1))-methyltransferase [Candidatus Ornithomonoglobus sp.]
MLTPRLNCIINYVNADTAADIGTDHAYVSIELIRSGRAKRVIASDVRKGPLDIAKGHIEKYGLCGRIETRLGGGLSVLEPGEADTIIIAGMGGELIEEIIRQDEAIARASQLILQPMNSQYELRKYLLENGFTIEKEDIECEGHRVYNLLIVKSGEQKPFEKDIDYHLPPYLYNHEKFGALLDKKQREFIKIIKGLEKSENCDIIKLEYFKECYRASEVIKNAVS